MQHTETADREEPVGLTDPSQSLPRWQRELRDAFRPLGKAEDRTGPGLPMGPDRQIPLELPATSNFPVVIPPALLETFLQTSPEDPVARQFLPSALEESLPPGFSQDAVGDRLARQTPGMIQKYYGRVLLIVTGTCAVHCRYCFRRHYPYADEPKSLASFEPALEQINDDPSISEVILSGGDPLSRTDDWLGQLVGRLSAIPHLRTLRVHTRFPVVIPSRVTEGLLNLLTSSRLDPVVVLHVNHARELSSEARDALRKMRESGIPLLNQSVLLAGVNDSVESLESLSRDLFSAGVIPYYLHQLDRVAGAAHFEVPIERGLSLIAELRGRLPGYLVPRYVQEIPGQNSKRTLA
ncbi:EF-P beta-lysylation protein EpmB [bacterium]|nr:EF-P beta-lysylation protein EpmB [bacterium]